MKRALALILTLVMAMALVACGGNKPANAPSTPGSTPSSTPSITPSKPSEPTPGNPTTSTPAEKPAEDPDAWKYGGNLRIGTANAWTSFDPQQNASSGLGNQYTILHYAENMAIKDINGKIYPQICDVEESADGLTVKFTLRERYFSNGKKVTIEDVDASIRRAAALSTASGFKKVWDGTTYQVDGNTITLTAEKYNINMLSTLVAYNSAYRILPKEICDKYPVEGGEAHPSGMVMGGTAPKLDKVEDAIGSGPYKIQSWSENEVVLARNEKYVSIPNEDAVGVAKEAKCYLDTITFQLNKDAASRTAATMTGEYDVGSVTAEMQDTAKTMGVKFLRSDDNWTHGIFFNLHESNADSPIADVNVRRAIRACLDIDAIMLVTVKGDKSRLESYDPYPVVRESVAYATTKIEDSGEWNIKDLDKAKAYLAQSNYKGEKIVYMVSAGSTFYNIAVAAIPNMEAIGLNIELKAVDSGSHSGLRKDPASGYDIGCWETQKHTENPVLKSPIVSASQGWWSSPARDAAYAAMNSAPTGSPESVAAYQDYLDAVIDECPYILFGSPVGQRAVRENVELDIVGQINYYYWNCYFNDNNKK